MNITNTLKKNLYKFSQFELARIDRLRDSYQDQTCHVFGDGSSVKWFDLESFPSLPSFTLSYMFLNTKFQKMDNKVFGVLTEPYYFYPYFRLTAPPHTLWRNRLQERYREFIRENRDFDFFVNLSNYPVLRRSNIYHLFTRIPNAEFCEECLDAQINPFAGSLNASINLAIYLGFKKIILVGCDYTHSPYSSLHWYEKGEGITSDQKNYNVEFFKLAQRHAEIITITRDGESDYLPYMTYHEYTGDTPVYRENTDIVAPRDLELLDSWPGYSIY